MTTMWDHLIVGGGFFGMYLAEHLAMRGSRVLLVEREPDFMSRASYRNQARVHRGYHYPRSVLTALRSCANYPRFVEEFSDCIDDKFEQYYLIGRILGKVTARQFERFCAQIGAPLERAPLAVQRLVNPHLVEAAYETTECAFDANKLREVMRARVQAAGVSVRLETSATRVHAVEDGLEIELSSEGQQTGEHAREVFCCTYSHINELLENSALRPIPLKHEMTEMCLVEVPEALAKLGFTVMCGPFFSLMPFPARGLHTLSHVRYTPHYEWHDTPERPFVAPRRPRGTGPSAWRPMYKDAQRYVPAIAECTYSESLWEVKTVLPRSEVDDSRPILFQRDCGARGLHCVMGGKIDNVYDVLQVIASHRS